MSDAIDKIKGIINSSGHSFHFKVLDYLEKQGWKTVISPYYTDNLTNRTREIDLIAVKGFDVNNSYDDNIVLKTQLFIECKYINQKTVFWFHDKNIEQTERLIVKKLNTNSPPAINNTYIHKHHYLDGKVKAAKLFADERNKTPENEPFFKALNQSLNALIYFRDKGSGIKIQSGHETNAKTTLNFPIIICNSFENLYQVDLSISEVPSKIDENFQLEVNYAYVSTGGYSHNEYFLIDVVSFEKIDAFLNKIEKDAAIVGVFL